MAGATPASGMAGGSDAVIRFDAVSMTLHWLTAALVVGQLTTAWMLSQASDGAAGLLATHRSLGLVTWAVVLGRLVWRARHPAPPLPASVPPLQQLAAKANEVGLYLLLALQPLSGLGDSLFRGKPIVLFGLPVPALFKLNKAIFRTSHTLHEWGAIALLALIALHMGAVVYHGMRRDGVLGRMLPGAR